MRVICTQLLCYVPLYCYINIVLFQFSVTDNINETIVSWNDFQCSKLDHYYKLHKTIIVNSVKGLVVISWYTSISRNNY